MQQQSLLESAEGHSIDARRAVYGKNEIRNSK